MTEDIIPLRAYPPGAVLIKLGEGPWAAVYLKTENDGEWLKMVGEVIEDRPHETAMHRRRDAIRNPSS